MKKYRISFIAAGRMANSMATQLKKLDNVELAGVFDILQDRSIAFAKKYGFEKNCTSREELLSDKTVDGIVICNYCHQHCETVLAALNAGFKFIFCEKPAVRKVEEAPLLRDAAAAHGAKIMIGHHRKHIPACRKLKELIEQGRLGKIRFAKVNFCNSWYSRDWNDYFASYEQSGGTTLDMVTHYVDLLNWYFGKAESVSARALMLEKTVPKEVNPVDYVNATLVYKNGVICGIESSYQRYGVSYDTLEIYGDDYTAVTDYRTLKLYRKKETIEFDVGFGEIESEQLEQAKNFVAMIGDGIQRQTTLEEGLASACTVLGMMASSEKGGELFRY